MYKQLYHSIFPRYKELLSFSMRRKAPLFFSLLFSFFCLSLQTAYGQSYIQEKAKLHVAKELYMTGEIIWGKVYVTDALFERPTQLSKLAYVEFWDTNGNLVMQNKVLLNMGSGNFSIKIPQSLLTGFYQIRAYTKWMANGPSHEFANFTFRIFNPSEPIPLKNASELRAGKEVTVSLFPEGGSLIHGMETRVGVNIKNDLGHPVSTIGRIEQADATIVAAFQSNEEGLAEFSLLPDSNETYRLRILQEGDSTQVLALPKTYTKGIGIQVEQKDDRLIVHSRRLNMESTATWLVVSKGGYELEKKALDLSTGDRTSSFSLEDLPVGKNMIQVRNEQDKILAWRYVWISQKEDFNLGISLSKKQVGKREKMRIEVEARDTKGNPVMANLGLSVAKQIPSEKAKIFEPDHTSELHMLTHPVPLEILRKKPLIFPELFGITVSGKIKDFNSETDSTARIILSLPGKVPYIRTMKTNKEGRFNFVLENVYGVREIGLLAVDLDGGVLNIELDPVFYGKTPYPSPEKLRFSESELSYLNELYFQNQLLFAFEDTFPSYTEKPIPSLGSFYGPPNRQYILDEYTRFDTEETFNEIVYSVALRKKRGIFSFRVYNQVSGILMKTPPLVLFDGIPLIDANELIKLNSKLIEKIEVLSSVYYQDKFPLYGIVNVTSFKGDASILELPKYYVRKPYTFLAPGKNFVEVNHEQENLKRIPDQRNLLHWEPQLQTNAEGKAFFEFYTSDIPGTFEIKASGLSLTGLWSEKMETFQVVGPARR